MGGKNEASLVDDAGPWSDYEIVDGATKDDIVGIKKKGTEGGATFTIKDLAKLPNPMIPEGFEVRP